MPERGAPPNVHPIQRRVLRALEALSTPLFPGDYLEMINPLWSTRELKGRIEEIRHETSEAATVTIRPGYSWPGHKPGQYIRIGVDIDGVRHWRAYSLTSDPYREDGLISITPKRVDAGTVSPYLVGLAGRGTIVSLSKIEGEFVLPDPPPPRLLFVSAGSGVTPIMSMLRHLDHYDQMDDAILLHSARHSDEVIFGPELRELAERRRGFHLHEQLTGRQGRMGPADLERLCPDWRERETYISGPNDMLEAFYDHFEQECDPERLHMERFQPKLGLGQRGEGEGGAIKFLRSKCETESDGHRPILVAGEEAGLELPFGCREGICHTCVGELHSGRVRDLRTGKVYGQEGEVIRTCISAPEGPIEIEL
jgi:stearoyl-CoA 9-desaturase NADPH oxidoreductase